MRTAGESPTTDGPNYLLSPDSGCIIENESFPNDLRLDTPTAWRSAEVDVGHGTISLQLSDAFSSLCPSVGA